MDVPKNGLAQHGHQGHHQGDFQRGTANVRVFVSQQEVGADAHDEEGARNIAGIDDVKIAGDGGRVEYGAEKVRQDGAATLDFERSRSLHPGIGHNDPERGESAAQGDEERGNEAHGFRDFIPAEKQQPDERRLEEEGKNPFRSQRRPENVPDELGILGPVGPELKFHVIPEATPTAKRMAKILNQNRAILS
jgi:hypothetical protein